MEDRLDERGGESGGPEKERGRGRRLRHCGWYVVQVTAGSERRMCAAIRRACAEADERAGEPRVGLEEVFNPRYASRKKRMGNWYDTVRMLLPGYVIAVVRHPAGLARALRGLEGFARVLASQETYSPLDKAEREWLESQTRPGERIVPLSFGCKRGDKLIVSEGPLKGREAMITKLDRKNCIAHVELHVGQMTLKTAVGLVVMPSGKVRNL